MPTLFHLVRHAAHDRLGKVLVGRLNGVHLSLQGREQAEQLAAYFKGRDIAAIVSSPRERAQETAAPIAATLDLRVRTSNGIDEHDCGGWRGRSFEDLSDDPAWRRWNAARSFARPPSGESMAELQARVLSDVMNLHGSLRDQSIILVSHAEPIRALLLHVLGLSTDVWNRIEIGPASISTVAWEDFGARVLRMNECVCERVAA
jgi:broad specificity phosphatase PhoE